MAFNSYFLFPFLLYHNNLNSLAIWIAMEQFLLPAKEILLEFNNCTIQILLFNKKRNVMCIFMPIIRLLLLLLLLLLLIYFNLF